MTIGNSPPEVEDTISEGPSGELTLGLITDDADGDQLVIAINWSADGVPQPALDDLTQVDGNLTSVGENWTYQVVVFDGTDHTNLTGGHRVGNSAPTPPSISLTPTVPRTLEDLECNITSLSTDPDGDNISFRWWQFREAGTYDGMIRIDQPLNHTIRFIAPEVEQSCSIHIILEVKDRGEPALFSFQRMIITVNP